MKIKVFLFILFLLSQSVFAYAENWSLSADTINRRLFDHAKNTPAEVSLDIDQLVDYLKQPAASKRDIVKTFSYWIMQNISYDIYGFMAEKYNQDGIAGTLNGKKGVCQDYSELFKAMCDRADIKCYIITGYAKAFDYIPGNKFNKANHAWNMVFLDGDYFLMDLTWSSGYIANIDNTWRYFLRADPSQFFADPALFVEKHLPSDPKWQLLNHPVSMNSFLKFEDRQEMFNEPSNYFNFRDSISLFESLGKDEQDIKAADDAYNFYAAPGDYAYHYYNSAVNYCNTATDYYNAAVNSFNKAQTSKEVTKPAYDYNEAGILNAIANYNKAIKLLVKINHYNDAQINADELLGKCNKGVEVLKQLLDTLK